MTDWSGSATFVGAGNLSGAATEILRPRAAFRGTGNLSANGTISSVSGTSSIGVAVVAAKTSTGHQNITTTDLGGATPKAVLFYYSRAATDAAVTTDGQVSYGACDGTNQVSYCTYMKNNQTSPMAWSKKATTTCLCSIKDFTGTVDSEASFFAFIANGVTVDWTTASSAGYLITALFFAGSDWTAQVGTATLSAVPTDVTLGWQPNCVFAFNCGNYISYGTAVGPEVFQNSFGFESFAPGGAQMNEWGLSFGTLIGGGGPGIYNATIPKYILQCVQQTTGFTFTQTQLAYGQGHIWGYLALKYTGVGTLVGGQINTDFGTAGNKSFSGLGGKPGGFLLLMFAQAYNGESGTSGILRHASIISNNNLTKTGGWAYAGKGTNVFSQPAPPFAEFSTANEDSLTMLTYDGTVECVGSVASYDSNGFTINISSPLTFPPTQTNLKGAYLTIINYTQVTSIPRRIFAWVSD